MRLTIVPRLAERPAPHHALGPVSQGHAAAQGRGSVEVAGRLAGGADAVGARDHGGAAGDRGDLCAREKIRGETEGEEGRGQQFSRYTHTQS